MKSLQFKPRFGSCLLFIMISFFLLFSACGGDRSSSDDSSSNSGSIVFSVVWPNAVNQNSRSSARAVNCGAIGNPTIKARLYNSSNAVITSKTSNCDAHSLTISGVSPGSGMRLLLEGIIGTAVEYQGKHTGITVTAGQTYDAGEITMTNVGDTLYWDIGNWDEMKWG
jgi:hypothetical protein